MLRPGHAGDGDPVAGSALMNSRDVERAEDVPSDG